MAKSIYGYFEDLDPATPAYDPGFDVPCPVCMWPVGRHLPDSPIMTISVGLEDDSRSYFYRIHKACHDAISDEQRQMLDEQIVDARIKITKDMN